MERALTRRMKSPVRIFIHLLFYSLIVFALSVAAINILETGLAFKDLLLPGLIFPAIIAVSFIVFIAGREKAPERQPVYTMAAVGTKFVLSSVFALTYFIILKRSGPEYIILFFLLYLAFTVYLLKVILKVLNVKSLK